MKLVNLPKEKLDAFFEVIKKCKGNVYLISPDMHIFRLLLLSIFALYPLYISTLYLYTV